MITLYGVTADGTSVPVQVTDDGRIVSVGQTGEQGPPGPQGPPGEQGPPGQDGQDGQGIDPDGNLDVSGNIAAEIIQAGGDPDGGTADGAQLRGAGVVYASRGSGKVIFSGYETGSSSPQLSMKSNGNIVTKGTVESDAWLLSRQATPGLAGLYVYNNSGSERIDEAFVVSNANSSSSTTFKVNWDGAVSAVSDKCGFNASGELVFTSRGARYRLVVQGGLAVPEEYTRAMQLKEKAQQLQQQAQQNKPGTQDIVPED